MNYQGAFDRVLRLNQVEETVGLKRAQIWNLEHAGKFPRRFKVCGARAVGWSACEIEQWMQALISGPREVLGSRPGLPLGRPLRSKAAA